MSPRATHDREPFPGPGREAMTPLQITGACAWGLGFVVMGPLYWWVLPIGFWTALPFWTLTIFAAVTWWCGREPFRWLVILGAGLNAAVVLANGGQMPVVGGAMASGIWRPPTSADRLLWLADQAAFGGASFGDGLLLLGILGQLATAGVRCARGRRRVGPAPVLR